MFENSTSICYTFFAVDDVIVTSINTYMSMMEDIYVGPTWSNLCQKNKKYGALRLLKCFLTKTGVLVDWKRW